MEAKLPFFCLLSVAAQIRASGSAATAWGFCLSEGKIMTTIQIENDERLASHLSESGFQLICEGSNGLSSFFHFVASPEIFREIRKFNLIKK
jgi:hypothetical protein